MTNDGRRAAEPTSYDLRPPQAPGAPAPDRIPATSPDPSAAVRPVAPAPRSEPSDAGPAPVSPVSPPVPGAPFGAAPASPPAGGGADPVTGRLIGGRYRLVSRLGHGGMGTVWRAHDETVDRQVAVKEPRVPESLPAAERETVHLRMRREARAAARIDHPAVVTVHDVVVEDGRPWLVMEWVRGQSLAARLADGTLDVREAARIGLAVLGALEAAHAAGVLHRDVKPDNVLLGGGEGPAGDERVVLTDFGIARVEGEQGLTETGAFVGSPEYVAPERVLGQRPGPASDLWSLGVVLYTVVEGVSPFRRANAPATLQAVLSTEPAAPSRGTGTFADLIGRILRKDPALRPGAAEIRQVLESVARPPQPVQPAPPTPVAYDPTVRFGGHPTPVPAPAPAAKGGRWVPPILQGNRKAGFGLAGGALALAAALVLVVLKPFGGTDDGTLPDGWEVRNDREVLSASVAVPSDYRRVQDSTEAEVTYYDPSGVFRVYLEKVDPSDPGDKRKATPTAWREFYERGGKDGRDMKDQSVTVQATTHQGVNAFDSTVTFLPYYASGPEEEQVRKRWRELVVTTEGPGPEVYWWLRVAGPSDGWAAKEGDRLFEGIVANLKIEGL